MSIKLEPYERVIISLDLELGARETFEDVRGRILRLVDLLYDLRVVIKLNAALRALGYGIIELIMDRGLEVFADLKLVDIRSTLEEDGIFLARARPRLLTVMLSDTTVSALKALRQRLVYTEVLGVMVLTELNDVQCLELHRDTVEFAMRRFAPRGVEASFGGVVCAPAEAPLLRSLINPSMTINSPNIRIHELPVLGDTQDPARGRTIFDAIAGGVDRIIVGRPVTQAIDPRGATRLIVNQVADAIAKRSS